MELTDTHCHLQFDAYKDIQAVIERAATAGVTRLVCVGTNLADSRQALEIARSNDNVWATAGIHPHEAKNFTGPNKAIEQLELLWTNEKVVAIGELGLDYYKNFSSPVEQQSLLRAQIELGLTSGLPFVFHVRDAWEDFWKIFDDYHGITGVIHSFSATRKELDQALERGLFVALNGIMTFTKDSEQLEAAEAIPLERLLLETDAPFLAPAPYRGEVCEPKHLRLTAEFLSRLREEPVKTLAYHTNQNSRKLFGLPEAQELNVEERNETP